MVIGTPGKIREMCSFALSSRLLPSLGNQTKLAGEQLALSRFLSPAAEVSLLFPAFGCVSAPVLGGSRALGLTVASSRPLYRLGRNYAELG